MAGFVLRCPFCREKIPWHNKEGPSFCPECGEKTSSDRADDDVVMPFVKTSGKTAAVDKVYRDMEKGSEVRAQLAADMLGVPVSEMADLKITNMKDRQKPGDIAVAPVNNPVSQFMAANPGAGGFNPNAGLAYSGAVQTGATPMERNIGARMRGVLQNTHGAGGGPVSDRPANEVFQPGYRRRV